MMVTGLRPGPGPAGGLPERTPPRHRLRDPGRSGLPLGLLFWKDLETHHPGIDSPDLAPDVAVAWKQRMQYRTVLAVAPGGCARRPRCSACQWWIT